MNRSLRISALAGLGLLAAVSSAHAYEIDPLTRQPLAQDADPTKAQATTIPREIVNYPTRHAPGTIVVNTQERRLCLVMPDGKAMRYGVGVGRPGFDWAGSQSITRKAEWPDWTPPEGALDWMLFGLLGAFGWAGHQLMTAAHRYAPASVLAPFVYTQLFYMTLASWIVFAQPPTAWVLAGAPIVAASGFYIWWRERQLAGRATEREGRKE